MHWRGDGIGDNGQDIDFTLEYGLDKSICMGLEGMPLGLQMEAVCQLLIKG